MLVLNLKAIAPLTTTDFKTLCHANPEAKLELTETGELVIMSPTGGETGNRNLKLTQRLANWTDNNATGLAFDSSTMFQLPNGAFRSPDAAWIENTRWNSLSDEQQKTFPPICPDFVIELRSQSDRLQDLQNKIQEYMDNGAKLGWLIDPLQKQVEIFSINQPKAVLVNPSQISGEPLLSGFILSLDGIF